MGARHCALLCHPVVALPSDADARAGPSQHFLTTTASLVARAMHAACGGAASARASLAANATLVAELTACFARGEGTRCTLARRVSQGGVAAMAAQLAREGQTTADTAERKEVASPASESSPSADRPRTRLAGGHTVYLRSPAAAPVAVAVGDAQAAALQSTDPPAPALPSSRFNYYPSVFDSPRQPYVQRYLPSASILERDPYRFAAGFSDGFKRDTDTGAAYACARATEAHLCAHLAPSVAVIASYTELEQFLHTLLRRAAARAHDVAGWGHAAPACSSDSDCGAVSAAVLLPRVASPSLCSPLSALPQGVATPPCTSTTPTLPSWMRRRTSASPSPWTPARSSRSRCMQSHSATASDSDGPVR